MLGKSVATGGETDLFGRRLGDIERRLGEVERARMLADLTALLAAGTAWTPDYTFGGAARTPGSPAGRYVKLGPLVFLNFVMTAQSTESGSAVSITNLPFTPVGTDNYPSGRIRYANGSSGNLFVRTSGVLDVYDDAIANPALGAGQRMDGSAIYEAAP